MSPLSRRLATLRFKVRFLDGWLGVCALLALVLGVGVSVGVLDYFVHIPSLIRAAFLVATLVGSGFIAYRYLIHPFARPCDDLDLALRIEEEFPELNDSLASTVQFMQQSQFERERLGGSEALRERTVQEATAKAAQCDFGRILDRRAAVLFGAAAACVLGIAGFVVATNRAHAGTAFWRFVEPFGEHTWTRISVERLAPVQMAQQGDKYLLVEPKSVDRVAKGRPYFIKVNLQGQMPRKHEARVEIKGQVRTDKTVPLKVADDKLSASFETGIDMTEQPQTFQFRILANDGAFPPRANTWHTVEVLPPPKLDKDSPQITILPPAYTDLKPEQLGAGNRSVRVFAGSTVILRARTDRPIEEAWIEYRPLNDKLIPASVLAAVGHTDPLLAASSLVGSGELWNKIPAQLQGDKMSFSVTFVPWVNGDYVLYGVDADKLDFKMEGGLQVELDPVPDVKLLSPRTSQTVLPNANINFKFLVSDEQFAIRSIYVEHRRKQLGADSEDPPGQNRLYEARDHGKLLPALLAQMTRTPIPGAHPLMGKTTYVGPDLRLRPKKMEVDMVWALRNQFKEGDVVKVEVCAEDFCDLYPLREPGRSHAIELRIISKRKMLDEVDTQLAEINTHLKKAAELEKKSLTNTKVTRKEEKIDQKVVENFVDNVEGPQKDVKDRVDTVRQNLKDLKQMLKDNNLTGERAYKDAGKIQGALDNIAQQELPQIDAKVAEIRNELTKAEKNDPKIQKKLDETARLQDSVAKSLDELIKQLNPQAKMQDFKKQIGDIAEKEKNLNDALQLAADVKDANDKNPNLTPKQKEESREAFRDQLNKARQEQLDLANQTDKLIKDMKNARDEFLKDGDKKNAQKLDDAIKNLEQPEKEKLQPKQQPPEEKQPPIPAQMKDVADQLKKNQVPEKTLQQQKDIVKNLEKTLDALDGKTEQALNQDIKDRQDADKKVEELAKKLEKLREENKKIQMMEDKEERLKAKEKLAEKHAELQEEIEQMRRELARLNEQQAANDLKDAADKLDKAANELKQDGNPQQDQAQAKKDLDKARQELKDAQEELARELLIKMADQLEGLKMRQIAALQRSDALHAKILDKKSWRESFLDTMDGNIAAQKEIAEETGNLKDKLKEAKVFHSILEKAKKSMDDAAEVMTNRRDLGKERRYIEMDPPERMPANELKEEEDDQARTLGHQKQAVKRLDNILNAIKEEIAKKEKEKEKPKDQAKEPKEGDPKKPKDEQAQRPNPDPIPPMAQLKALRAEQLDLNERTTEFANRTDMKMLTDQQKEELRQLSVEQAEIHRLFAEMIAEQNRQKEMMEQNQPKQQKEGAPK